MSEKEIRIVELEPMKVARFYGFSESPEGDASAASEAWLDAHGLHKKGKYRNFGFNNPNPSPGSPKYGYEVWILPEGKLPEDPRTEFVEFPGGLYAVMSCNSLETIGADWQNLVAWRDTSEYQHANHQWLEEIIDPPVSMEDLRFLLYLPISK